MIRHIDFTKPQTIRQLAALPYYGQAEALIRRHDPWWKVQIGEPRTYNVVLERMEEMNCPTCGKHGYEEMQTKTLEIEARSPEEAEEIATTEFCTASNEWVFHEVENPKPPEVRLPDELPEITA